MTPSFANKKRVYVACRSIFAGFNSQIRKVKKIREIIDAHKSTLAALIQDLGRDVVVAVVKSLLDRKIFSSELKAKVEFPDLFRSSPALDVQRAASEHNAANSVAEALEEIESLEEDNEIEDMGEECHANPDAVVGKVPGPPELDVLPIPTVYQPTTPASANNPSLYPLRIPYQAQHQILCTVQNVLEECCFDFVKQWMPSVLLEHGWSCATEAELTKWTRILAKRSGNLPSNSAKVAGSALHDVLLATHNIRHTAVHRLPTTFRGIHQLIKAAVQLAEALKDTLRAAQLEELGSEVDSKIRAMELNKNILEDRLGRELLDISRQREELDKKEMELRENVSCEDQENKSLIGLLLEESVNAIFNEDYEVPMEFEDCAEELKGTIDNESHIDEDRNLKREAEHEAEHEADNEADNEATAIINGAKNEIDEIKSNEVNDNTME